MTPDERDRVQIAAHELAHGLVGKLEFGRKVRYLVMMPSHGATDFEPRTEPETDATLADDVVMFMAGAIAAKYVAMDRISLPPRVADAAVTSAIVGQLPDADREYIAYTVRHSDVPGRTNDEQRAADYAARVSDPKRGTFLADCSRRAVLLVFELLGLIEALIPLALSKPILTGDDLEAGIAALRARRS